MSKTKKEESKYKLRVQIGKKPKLAGLKKRVFNFEAETHKEMAQKIVAEINIPKMVEECFFTLESKEKKWTRTMNALKARRIFNNELNAFYFIKQMSWMLK